MLSTFRIGSIQWCMEETFQTREKVILVTIPGKQEKLLDLDASHFLIHRHVKKYL